MGCCGNSVPITKSLVKPFENDETEKKNDNKIDVTKNDILDTEREIINNLDNIKTMKELAATKTGITELINITGKNYVNKSINNEKYFSLALKEYELLSECFLHPNIIHFKYIYKEKKESHINSINLIIEYADDGDLNTKLERQKNSKEFYDELTLIFWMMQICIGLAYMHKKNIVHRDIKPANIFLNKNGLIKIGDLGLSKKYKSKNEYVKKSTIVGTKFYIAPELIEKGIFCDKSDIYSLGRTFSLFINSGNNYSNDFINLINELIKDNYYERPSAEEIFQKTIIKEKMDIFLKKKEFEKGYSFIIMKNLNEEGNIKFENDDSFINKLKNCWNELFEKLNPNKNKDDKIRKKRDLDILMCLIYKRIHG